MKLKCKKIRNIDKSICTCEQKIAYNYAWEWYEAGKNILNSNCAEFVKSDAIMEIEQNVIDSIKFHEIDKKYNIDAIIIAFRNGFRNYCNNYFIAYNYEIIGKVFYIPYDVV